MTAERNQYRVEALARGLRIMRLFTRAQPQLRLNEIAMLAQLPLPTAFRLVATLEEAGFLERQPDGSLRPGLAVLELGFAALQSDDVVQQAEPALRRLSDAVGENVNLAILHGSQVLFIGRIRNESVMMTANIHVGSTRPAIVTSIGKLLLAHLPPEEVDARISEQDYREAPGPNAIHSPAELHEQLEEIRRRGWAVQDEEDVIGLRSVAVPIRDATGRVAAGINIAVSTGTYSLQGMVDELLPPLLETAGEISHRLGAPGAAPRVEAS